MKTKSVSWALQIGMSLLLLLAAICLRSGAAVAAPAPGASENVTEAGVTQNHTSMPSTPTQNTAQFTITVRRDRLGGTVSPCCSVPVDAGTDKSFEITLNPGFQVADVKVDGVSVGAVMSYTFTNVVQNHYFDVYFECAPSYNPFIRWIPGDQYQHLSGYAVAGIGDLNGDGKSEYIIGRPGSDAGSLVNCGSAIVYNGADGAIIYWYNGAASDDYFGWSVAGAGDVDGDGTPDFIIGAPYEDYWIGEFLWPDYGSAYVYSGRTFGLICQITGSQNYQMAGWSVAGVGDVAGPDGKAEFIVGSPGADAGSFVDCGNAIVYTESGAIYYWMNGEENGAQFGTSVAGAGDIDGDGRPDWAIGAPYANPGGRTWAGSAYVYSATGALLYKKNGDQDQQHAGMSVAGVGDVSGDGKAEFIIGSPKADAGSLVDCGNAIVYSGADGAIYWWMNGEKSGDFLGRSVAGVGDANNDDRPDYVVGAPFADRNCDFAACVGAAYVVSGFDGVVLTRYSGVYGGVFCSDGDQFGFAVAGAGDVNGDGGADIMVGAPYVEEAQPNPSDAGVAYIYAGLPKYAGDANGDGSENVGDAVYTISYIFKGGAAPAIMNKADVNADCLVNVGDAVYMIAYIFRGGLAPKWGCVGS